MLVMRLVHIGDVKALPILHKLEKAAGSEPISGLSEAIQMLSDSSRLLRMANDAGVLLRPAGEVPTDVETLLRPRSPDG